MLEPPRANRAEDGQSAAPPCRSSDRSGSCSNSGTSASPPSEAERSWRPSLARPDSVSRLQMLQVGLHLSGALVALGLVLLHRPADDVFQFSRNVGIQAARRSGLLVQHRIESGDDIRARRTASSRYTFRRALRRTRRGRCADRAVRCGPAPEPCRPPCPGMTPTAVSESSIPVSVAVANLDSLVSLARPKSRTLACPCGGEEDVGGLDVAVNDALRMRGDQGLGHLNRDVENLIAIHGLSMDQLLQALALQLLHHDEGMPVVVRRCRGWCRCSDG